MSTQHTLLKRWVPLIALATLLLSLFSGTAAAAGASCKDPWVTAALNSLGKGSAADTANNGLCNINRYRAASWSSQADLYALVQQSFRCNDPWIGEVYAEVMGISYRLIGGTDSVPPGNGATGECNPSNYGGGSWSSFADLRVKVLAYKKTHP